MNLVCLTGNITYIDNTKENATTIGLAVRRDYKNKDTGEYDTDFLNLVAFGYQKNYIGKYLDKGYKVEVIGSLRTSKYTDQTGQERTSQSIVINSISSLQAIKKQYNSAGYNTPYDYNSGSFNQQADRQIINDFMNQDGIKDDDLPF